MYKIDRRGGVQKSYTRNIPITVHGLKNFFNFQSFSNYSFQNFKCFGCETAKLKLLKFFLMLKRRKSFVSKILQYPPRKGLFEVNKLLT